MTRAWRFAKWFFSKCGWFEFVLFTTSFTLTAGLAAGEGTVRDTFWGIAIAVNGMAMLSFIAWGARNIWQDFKKHDEKMFEILKDKDIK
jgi:hypothetical protein